MSSSRAARALATCLLAAGTPLASLPAGAQDLPAVELTAEQSATLAAMKDEAAKIDKLTDPRAHMDAYRAIVDYAKTIYPPDHPEVVTLEGEVDFGYFMLGQIDALPARLERARDIFAAAGPAYRSNYIETVNNLAVAQDALGDSQAAIENQRLAVSLWREDAPPEGSGVLVQGLNNLAWSERGLGNMDAAFDLSEEALAMGEALLAAHPDDRDIADAVAVGINNRIYFFALTGRLDEASATLRDGIVRMGAVLGPDNPRIATMMLNGSNILIQTGQYAEAEEMARAALLIREQAFGPESPTAAEARLNLIAALTAQGRDEDALPLAQYTVDVLTGSQGEEGPQTLEARAKLANIYMGIGRLDEGLAAYEGLVDTFRRIRPPGHPDIEYYLDTLAMSYSRMDYWDRVPPVLDELEASMAGTQDAFTPPFFRMLALRAQAEARLGHADMARAYVDRAMPGLVAAWRTQAENEGAQGGSDRPLDWAFGWAANAMAEAGDTARAFAIAQYVGVGPSERSLLRARQREAATDPQVAQALRQRQDLVEQRQGALNRFQAAASAGDAEASVAAAGEVQALDGRIAAFDLEDAPLLQPEDIAPLQQRLAPDAALLFVVETDTALRLFAVTADGVASDSSIASTASVHEMVESLRANIAAGIASGTQYDTATAARLHDAIFTPAIRALTDGRGEIAVIARGELAKLPFAILVGEGGRFTIEDHAFSYPIEMSGVGRRLGAANSRFASFLGIGAPALPGPDESERAFRGGVNTRAVIALGPLGLAEGELRAMAAAMQAAHTRILAGAEATEAETRALDLPHADVLTFATHGVMGGELEGLDEAALVLSPPRDGEPDGAANDGLLTASEIATLDLTAARLVVLSACNTASGNDADGEAFGGLAQAFLYAGADSLLVSHWRVRDDAAARLTVATAEGTAQGLDPAEALRRAQLELMHDASVPQAASPAIWAPFVFVGG